MLTFCYLALNFDLITSVSLILLLLTRVIVAVFYDIDVKYSILLYNNIM